MNQRFKAEGGRRLIKGAPSVAEVRKSGRPAIEPLESRRLLAVDLVGVPGPSQFTTPSTVVSDGTYAYYFSSPTDNYQAQIWRSDGTAAGSRQLGAVSSGNIYSTPREFKLIGGRLFLLGRNGNALELYALDSQTDQIQRLSNFGYPGAGEEPHDLVEFNGQAYLVGWTLATGYELFTSDGTSAGTKVAFDLVPGSADGVVECTKVGNELYLTAQTGPTTWSVYRSNGTQAGTTLLKTFTNANPYRPIDGFAQVGNKVVFDVPGGDDDTLWVTDGTAANTKSLGVAGGLDMVSGGNFAVFRSRYNDGGGRLAVYRTDGTAAGTVRLGGADVADNPPASRLITMSGAVYASGVNGLFRITATASDRIFEGYVDASYIVGDRIYFSGSYGALSSAVGVTDGTLAGTQLLYDPGERPPTGFAAVLNGYVVFGGDNALLRLPLNAPRLPGFSGHLFRDFNANGVYDPGEVQERSAGLNISNLPINSDGSFDLKWMQPATITVSAYTTYEYVVPTTPTSYTLKLEMGQAATGIDFGFRRLNIVRGTVRIDANADEVASDAEPAAPGETVWADFDEDGVVDPGEPTVISSASGAYEFGDLPAGRDVLIRVQPRAGWFQSAPAAAGVWVHTTLDGGVLRPGNLGVSQQPPPNYVSALVFEDLDRDGTWDPGEPLRQNSDVWVDLNDNGLFDANEPTRSGYVSPRGEVRIRLPGPGQYRVRAPLPAGWESTTPTLITVGAGESAWGMQLGVAMPAPRGTSIAGVAFVDIDHDGIMDPGDATQPADPPNPNTLVYLDSDGDFGFDTAETSALTDSLGRFTFNNLSPGRYAVRQALTGTLWQTAPAPGDAIIVDLASGQQRTDLRFGAGYAADADYGRFDGTAFLDANADGIHAAGEGAFTDTFTVFFLDANNNETADPSEPRATLTEQGEFQFANVLPGRYRLRMIPPGTALELSPLGSDHAPIVNVSPGSIQSMDVGVYRPVSRVASSQFLQQTATWRLRLQMQDVWDPATVKAAFVVTGADGKTVAPTQLLFPGGTSPLVEFQYNRILAPGDYRVSIPGSALRGSSGIATPSDFAFTFTIQPAAITARRLFYNNSFFDINIPAAGPTDDAAIATDKSALLPGGGKASAANVSSYDKGINGIMFTVAGLPAGAGPGVGDFDVAVSTDGATWSDGPAPSVSIRRSATSSGDRVTLIWPDGSIKNTWLRLTLKATAATGLTTPDISYWGSAVGDTGNGLLADAAVNVDSADYYGVRDHLRSYDNRNPVNWNWDINRDGVTDLMDVVLVRASAGTSLQLITAPQQPVGVQAPGSGGSTTQKPVDQNTTSNTTTTTTAPVVTTRRLLRKPINVRSWH